MRSLLTPLIAAMLSLATGGAAQEPASSSTLIVNARVVDGTGAAAQQVAVRIEGDRIAAVGELQPRAGETVLDAGGKVLAPGFIDTHSHHDRGLEDRRDALPVISQGVTTIVIGQDGASHLPIGPYLAGIEADSAAINIASYTGHGTVRAAVLGADYRRAATAAELERMKALIAADMEAGSLGLATGLEYDPGIYSSREEVLALAREAARFGGRYISHMRSEDRALWDAVDEVIEIGRATGMPVQISHAKIALVDAWGQADRFIRRLDAARQEGVRISADIYPYEYWQSTLTVMFPDRNFRDRAAAEYALRSLAPADGLRLSRFRPDPSLVGRTVAEIAAMRGTDPASTLMALIAEAPEPGVDEMVIGTSMDPRDIAALLRWDQVNICSDGMLSDRHPRGAGSFTRVLRKYVREDRLLTLEQAIHRMTGLAAEHMGFADRGRIRPGMFADLVLFDPATVADRATIEDPTALSVGVERVWVNGRVVYENGRASGARPGRVVRRNA